MMDKNTIVDRVSYKELTIGSNYDIEKYGNLYCLVDEIISQGGTFIITDPRGKKLKYYYEELAEKGYTVYNIDINDYANGSCWNPLDMPYSLFKNGQLDKSKNYLVSMAEEIFMPADQRRDDEFWGASSANLFVGLAYGLFNIAEKPSMVNFSSIYQMTEDGLQSGLQSLSRQNNILKYFFEEMYDKDNYAWANVSLVTNAPSDTRGGILTTFFQKMRALVMSDNVSNIINQSGIDLKELSNDKIAIFLNYSPEQSSDQIKLINLFLRQAYLYACDAELSIHFILNDFMGLKYVAYIENMFLSQCNPNIYIFLASMNLFEKVYKNFSCIFFLTQSDQVTYLNRREFFIYAPDYLKEKVLQMDEDVEKGDRAIICKNDKLVTMIPISEYKKRNGVINIRQKNPPELVWEKFDIKTKVAEHQRQKLLLGRELNESSSEYFMQQTNKDRRFSLESEINKKSIDIDKIMQGIEKNTQNIDIDKMIHDIDNKLKELDEEERQQNEFQEVKKHEEIMRWMKIRKYIFRLILAMSIINILFSLLIKYL